MTVKTQKELGREELEKKISPLQKEPIQQPGQKLRYAVLMESAGKGKSSTTVLIPQFFEDEKKPEDEYLFKVELDSGVFYFPEKWSKEKNLHYLRAFKNAGFTDCTYQVKPAPVKKIGEYEYTLAHPENGPTPESKMRGQYSIKVDDKDIPLEIIDGYIKTEDKKIYAELIQQGWIEAYRKEIKK